VTYSSNGVPGTAGYAVNADDLARQYESVTFEDVYGSLAMLVPSPGRVMDIGAGTGRDAAALAAKGHRVLAVEPTAELRAHGQRLHAHHSITWCDDALPDLSRVHAMGERFDLILMTAVWMHLDSEEQSRALPRVASLLAPKGRILMSIRSGPIPAGRRMFEVPTDELIAQARALRLALVQRSSSGDMLGRDGVGWIKLAFEKINQP
jgi:SAM-dependent methyltransferase